MAEYGDFAASIARKAGALLMERFSRSHRIDYKGEIDLVTEADRISEELLIGCTPDITFLLRGNDGQERTTRNVPNDCLTREIEA
jgi:myo-inositol-1(or 4)-monophosphatase